MPTFPFASVAEATENAKQLHGRLRYFSIDNPSSAAPFSLQQTQELMAQLFGCARWPDLIKALSGNFATQYLGGGKDPVEQHRILANRLARQFHLDESQDRIFKALRASALGCMPATRYEARRFCNSIPYATAEQFGRVLQIENQYSYHARYNNRRGRYENELLRWQRDVAIAEVLGHSKPSKPKLAWVSR